MSSGGKITKNIAWLMFDQVFILLLQFLVGIKIANYYGAELYGKYNYAVSLVAFSAILFELLNSRVIKKHYTEDNFNNVIFNVNFFRNSMAGIIIFIPVILKFTVGMDNLLFYMLLLICLDNILTTATYGIENFFEFKLESRRIVISNNIVKIISYTLQYIGMLFGVGIMNVFVYYLINDIVIRDAKLHEKEMLELQVKNQIQMYRSVSENFDIQKRKSHEFKNQILCIEALLKDKEYDRAVDYVSKISKGFFKERNAINTNQVVVNAILNTKYEEAINKHIVFVFKVNDLSNIKMEDEDLVVILANLLNNAIEACENCIGKKVIKFKFMMEEQMIILSVKNTCNQMIIYHNNEIATTKMINQDEHGVGIKNIIRIVEKYNGEYVIQNDEDQFYFSIFIPL